MPEHVNVTTLLKALSISSHHSYLKCRRRCRKYRLADQALDEHPRKLLEKQFHDCNSACTSADDILHPASLTANPQAQSGFFRLPPEIRTLIYEEAIGRNVFHVVKKENCLGFKNCTGQRGRRTCYSDELWAIETPDGLWRNSTDAGPLSPLLSCRRFHEEAAPILYTHNTFSFQTLYTILDLNTILPSAYFHSIGSLLLNLFLKPEIFIDATCTQESEAWRRVWTVIASIQHLKDIRLTLSMVCTKINEVQEARILEPLCKVGHLKTFEVDVPWDVSEKVREQSPYRILKSGRLLKAVAL